MDINYELYKVFYHVATTLSFSEASKKLYISQSAVSQSIKALEGKLSQTLFIRSTKKVRLTAEGEILLRHIEPAVSLIRRGESRLLDSASTGGQIQIGASDTICRYFLVPYIERFHQAFPSVHIKVINATSVQCVELLKNGQADFIVVNHPNAYLNHLWSIRSIKQFRDVFIANQSFAHLKDHPLSLAELSEYPLLMLDKRSTTSEFLHSIFQQHALELVPEAELSSNDLLIDLARIGLGIAFVPDYCLKGQSESLFIVNTKEILPSRELALVYNDKLPISPAVAEFLNYFEPVSCQNMPELH